MVVATMVGHYMYVAMWETAVCILFRGQIRQITKDHSLVQEMVRMGEIKPEEARNHPIKIYNKSSGSRENSRY